MGRLALYRDMLRVRRFELLLHDLWQAGLVSGELHLGTGEEAVAVGVSGHLGPGDALALDHRGTPFLLLHGVDPVAMVREALGRDDGLCRGRGGHMHLFDPDRLSATSGIVGASAPLAAGFALAAQRLRPGTVAVATFGEGAVNQGMVMESLNLAAVWGLPLIFVCKDNGWAITTDSARVTGGDLRERAASFGLPAMAVDGLDPEAVGDAAGPAIARARNGDGPSFILARCSRLDSHMAGFVLDRMADRPIREGGATLRRVAASLLSPEGGGLRDRVTGLGLIRDSLSRARADHRGAEHDPVRRLRDRLLAPDGEPPERVAEVEAEVEAEIVGIRDAALAPAGGAAP